MRQLYFCSLWLTAASVLAPSLSGQGPGVRGLVRDPEGRPVEGARVTCGPKSALTDGEGRFAFPETARCAVTVVLPGFDPTTALATEASDLTIDLALAALSERVLVSAARSETTMEEAGVAATIVTRRDIEQREFPMVPDLLREVPGLHVTRFGRQGALTQVFARGSQRTGTLVMIDGIPINDPGGDLNFAHLATGDIERMEVIRGPESALFGAEASAAVIQLFTRRGNPERRLPGGSLSYERGIFQSDRWIANLAGGLGDRIDYSLTAQQLHTVGQYQNDFYRNTTGTASLGFRLSQATQLRAIYRGFDSHAGSPNRVAYGVFDFDANRQNRDSVAALRIDDVRGRNYAQRILFGHHRLRDRFNDERVDGPYPIAAILRDVDTPVRRTYLVQLLDPRNLPHPSDLPPGTRLRTTSVTLRPDSGLSTTHRTNFDYQGTLAHRDGAAIFGYEFESQGGTISRQDVTRENHGVFVHKQHSIANRISLAGGIRFERNSVFGRRFTPRVSGSVRLFGEHGILSSTYLRVSAGRGITEPSLLQVFARESTYVGNPNLRLERTASYEAGIVQEWFRRRLRTEVAAFRNSFRDLIVFATGSPIGTWENVDASWARGFEFSAQGKFLKYVTASGSYTLLWTRITNSRSPNSLTTGIGQELMRRPRNSGSLALSIAPRRWFFQGGAVFMGERQDSDVFGVTRNPGYHNAFAGGSYRLNNLVSPFFRVDNLTNTRFEEVLGYANLARTVRGGLRLAW